MEIREILKNSALPRIDTELLLAFLLGKSREFLLAHPNYEASPVTAKKYRELEKKRLNNWPLAYLTGEKEFYGLNFKVSPAVLTPRPETEIMVSDIIKIAQDMPKNLKPLLIDLGTGSGAIIISTAKELKRLHPALYRRSDFLAVDISGSALKMAKANAAHHKLGQKIPFFKGDLLSPLKISRTDFSQRGLIIAANLPYLTKVQIKKAPSISQEPRLALDGGRDGLKYYRELFAQIKGLTFESATILCEIDPGQTSKITALTAKRLPKAQFSIIKDFSGQDRFFVIRL